MMYFLLLKHLIMLNLSILAAAGVVLCRGLLNVFPYIRLVKPIFIGPFVSSISFTIILENRFLRKQQLGSLAYVALFNTDH